LFPVRGQEPGFGGGDSVDVTGMLNGGGGNRGGFNNNNGRAPIEMPDSKSMLSDIQKALNKGKTPLDKSQEKPIKSMLDQEVVTLSDRIQVLRSNNNNNNFNNQGFPGGGRPDFQGGGGFPGGGPPGGFPDGGFPAGGGGFPGGGRPDFQAGNQGGNQRSGNNGGNPQGAPAPESSANAQANALAVQVDTITGLKNDDFLQNKLPAFLTPEQVALIQKVKAADKDNATCLGGLLDRVSNGLLNNNNNNRGGNNNNNRGGNNNNNNFLSFLNSPRKPNGQPYCMPAEATASDRLEPIRKELAKGNLPLDTSKESIAEAFMKAQTKDLEDSLRTTITSSFQGNRGGGGGNNRTNNPQLVIQTATDNMYKKAGTMLNPPQTESLKKWHYQQILDRGGMEPLITIQAMQDTPLTDDQIARVTAAWTELRNQQLNAAKAAKKNPTEKELDSATTAKILEMLEPKQVASYQDAKKLVAAK